MDSTPPPTPVTNHLLQWARTTGDPMSQLGVRSRRYDALCDGAAWRADELRALAAVTGTSLAALLDLDAANRQATDAAWARALPDTFGAERHKLVDRLEAAGLDPQIVQEVRADFGQRLIEEAASHPSPLDGAAQDWTRRYGGDEGIALLLTQARAALERHDDNVKHIRARHLRHLLNTADESITDLAARFGMSRAALRKQAEGRDEMPWKKVLP